MDIIPNATLLIQFGIFLFLLFTLPRLLFRPMMEMFDRRERQVAEPAAQAEATSAEAQRIAAEYQRRIAQTLQKAEEFRNATLKDAASAEKEILSAAREENARFLARMREEMAQAREQALAQLAAQADRFGEEIAGTLLGKSEP